MKLENVLVIENLLIKDKFISKFELIIKKMINGGVR